MLLGTYQAKFAQGHRVAVPATFRKDLGEIYNLARWYERCLVLVGKSRWDALYKRLVGKDNLIVTPVRDTERFILAQAFEVVPDEQGRIVIPERLTKYSSLSEEIYFVGLGDKVEIWDKVQWEIKEKEVIKDAAKYIEEIAQKK